MSADLLRLAMLPLHTLRPHPRNVRRDLGDLGELVASIRAEGILQPLVVEPAAEHVFLVTFGHRRLAAAQKLRLPAAPCIIRPGVGARRTMARQLIENLHREPLRPLDEARAYKALIDDEGLTRSAIAHATGVSPSTITLRLALLELPDEAQQMVRDGRMSLGSAATLGRQVARSGKGSVTDGERCPRHFTTTHPLAADAKRRCDEQGHPPAGRVHCIACGACWEASIRDDVAGLVEHTVRPIRRARPGEVDEIAVERAVAGDRSVSLTMGERELAVRALHRRGLSDYQIAETLGITDRTVLRIRQGLDLPSVVAS